MLDIGDYNSKAVSLQPPTVESGVDMESQPLSKEETASKLFTSVDFCADSGTNNLVFPVKNISLGADLFGLDSMYLNEISESLVPNDITQTAELSTTKSSSLAPATDCGNLDKICAILQTLDPAAVDDKTDGAIELDDIENLFQLLDQAEKNKKYLERRESFLSLADLNCPDDTSLFPLANSISSSFTDCNETINDSSLTSDRLSLDDVFGNYLTESPGKIATLLSKEDTDDVFVMDSLFPDLSPKHLPDNSRRRTRYPSSVRRGQKRKRRICDSQVTANTFPVIKKQTSSVNTQKNAVEVLSYSLNRRAAKQVNAAVTGNGYVSEFAKFVQLASGEDAVPTSRQKLARVDSANEPRECQVDAMCLRRRSARKPVCPCCKALNSDFLAPKPLHSKKHVAREQCNVARQLEVTLPSLTTWFEQLSKLQIRVFCFLQTVFPFISRWMRFAPHSHSLELIIDELIIILKDPTGAAENPKLTRTCCPVVSLCCTPERCLKSLRKKTIILIQLMLPSVCLNCTRLDELESVIDQMIIVNKSTKSHS